MLNSFFFLFFANLHSIVIVALLPKYIFVVITITIIITLFNYFYITKTNIVNVLENILNIYVWKKLSMHKGKCGFNGAKKYACVFSLFYF